MEVVVVKPEHMRRAVVVDINVDHGSLQRLAAKVGLNAIVQPHRAATRRADKAAAVVCTVPLGRCLTVAAHTPLDADAKVKSAVPIIGGGTVELEHEPRLPDRAWLRHDTTDR